jgi:hypothetical protein
MKVRELIAALSREDQDAPVFQTRWSDDSDGAYLIYDEVGEVSRSTKGVQLD